MWRSRMFWQVFAAVGGLLLATLALLCLVASSQDTAASTRALVWSAAALVALPGLCGAWLLARRLTQPLQELTRGAEHIVAGDYGHRIFADSTDEVGMLARSINRTSEQLAAQLLQMHDDREQLRAVL